jgi:hypothetical protein
MTLWLFYLLCGVLPFVTGFSFGWLLRWKKDIDSAWERERRKALLAAGWTPSQFYGILIPPPPPPRDYG